MLDSRDAVLVCQDQEWCTMAQEAVKDEVIRCAVCGGFKHRRVVKDGRWIFVKCEPCNGTGKAPTAQVTT